MVRFKMICPDCGAAVMTTAPEAVVWERCQSCGLHIWDMYDALLADVVTSSKPESDVRRINADN